MVGNAFVDNKTSVMISSISRFAEPLKVLIEVGVYTLWDECEFMYISAPASIFGPHKNKQYTSTTMYLCAKYKGLRVYSRFI